MDNTRKTNMTRLKFLGTRANTDATSPYHSKHSGILLNESILFDLGEEEFLQYKPEVIFITHLHPDHAIFIAKDIEVQVPVYAPEESDEIEIRVMPDSVEFEACTVSSIPTIHSKLVESRAYLIEGEHRILYTGDMVWIEKKHHAAFGELDLVITDGSFIRAGGRVMGDKKGNVWGHRGIPDLVDFFKPYTERIVFTHLGKWFYRNASESRRKVQSLSRELKLDLAYDGMVLELA
jgi:ribonuclease BN (tRNA processing enzyme)